METRAKSRAEAKERGEKQYFTGKPCSKGHIANRNANGGNCCECLLEVTKVFRIKNKGKYSEQIKARNRHWYLESKDKDDYVQKKKERSKRYQAEKRFIGKYSEQKKVYSIKYYAENKDKIAKYNAEWRKNNLDIWALYSSSRRAKKKNGNGFTQKQIDDMLIAQDCKCVYCAVDVSEVRHIDHIMPLVLGGLHDIDNIQILCPKCNISKGGKHPDEYEQKIGFRRLKYAE